MIIERGRPAAVARQPAADAAPAAARTGASTCTRCWCACRASCRPSSRAIADRLRLRHQPAGVRRRPGAADAGGAQHRAQRRAGAGRDDAGAARSVLTTRVARGVTLGEEAPPARARARRSRTTARASRRRSATGSSSRWCPAARAAAASGSRSRRRSSRSTAARSNARARPGARCSRSCCRSNCRARRTREQRMTPRCMPTTTNRRAATR